LLLIGWKAAPRTDDLARLAMADLHASEQGLSVFIARSKTDQAGHGTTLGVAAPAADTTAGRAATIRRCSTPVPPGCGGGTCSAPTASSTAPPGGGSTATAAAPAPAGLHRNSIAEIIKRRAAAAGLEDATLWGGEEVP
jgi:hypothetical protein